MTSTRTSTTTLTPTSTATSTPTPTVTLTITPTGTSSPTRTATNVPTATPTLGPDWIYLENEFVTLAYPKDWRVEDRTHDEKCIPGLIDCIIWLIAPDDSSTLITLVRIDFSFFGKDFSVEEIDQTLWDIEPFAFKDLGLENKVQLELKMNIIIGGEPAVKRVFNEPYIKNNQVKGTLYVLRILVISQRHIYHFYLNTTNMEKFEIYQGLMDRIAGTIIFVP
jgi:hypothetical protein